MSMKRSREEYEVNPNGVPEEVQLPPPLNLNLTLTPEFITFMEPSVTQFLNQPNLPLEFQILKETGKRNPVHFPISKITIGEWTRSTVHQAELMAKFYFQWKKLMWEMLDNVENETGMAKLKRKIEMRWSDVLSFRPSVHSHDGTGILEVELSNRPTFFIETNPQSKTRVVWKKVQDFTQYQYASKCRRHTLHFAPGVLQKNLEKLLSSDKFWSDLIKVNFPTLVDPYFENGINQVHWSQVISQPILNDHYGEIGNYISESQMIEEASQLLEQALLETQTNSMHMNDDPAVSPEIGPNL